MYKVLTKSHNFSKKYYYIIYLILYFVSPPYQPKHSDFFGSCLILLRLPILHILPGYQDFNLTLFQYQTRRGAYKISEIYRNIDCILRRGGAFLVTPTFRSLTHWDCTTEMQWPRDSSTKHCTNSPAFSFST